MQDLNAGAGWLPIHLCQASPSTSDIMARVSELEEYIVSRFDYVEIGTPHLLIYLSGCPEIHYRRGLTIMVSFRVVRRLPEKKFQEIRPQATMG